MLDYTPLLGESAKRKGFQFARVACNIEICGL